MALRLLGPPQRQPRGRQDIILVSKIQRVLTSVTVRCAIFHEFIVSYVSALESYTLCLPLSGNTSSSHRSLSVSYPAGAKGFKVKARGVWVVGDYAHPLRPYVS